MRTDAIRLLPFLATLHANDLVPAVLNCERVGAIRVQSQSEVREHVNLQSYIHTDASYHSGTHRVGSTVAPNRIGLVGKLEVKRSEKTCCSHIGA